MHEKCYVERKFRAPEMIKYTSKQQISIEDFTMPFSGKLDSKNRWVILAKLLPWDEMVSVYVKNMSLSHGRVAIDPRVAVGSILIKHLKSLADEDTVEEIQENPYLQYFLGYDSYRYDQPFTPSLFVAIRRRLGDVRFEELTRELVSYTEKVKAKSKEQTKGKKRNSNSSGSEERGDGNKGHLIVDATVAPSDIKYPTDLDLLNDVREKSELLIDELYSSAPAKKKPRSYRQVARRQYLAATRLRKKNKKTIRKALGKQLRYIARNMKTIERLLDQKGSVSFPLSHTYQRLYWIIQEVYRQQRRMYEEKSHQVADRIVSVSQPYVRPIVRGKTGKEVEFGAKISVSLVDGMSYVHRISWDAYNESTDLINQIEFYRNQFGEYPQWVSADKIYGTRENRAYMRSRDIRFTGVTLGRPRELTEEIKGILKEQKQLSRQRSRVEGKLGEGKRKYDLGRVKAKKQDTSESWIKVTFFVMNITRLLRVVFLSLLKFMYSWWKMRKWISSCRKNLVWQIG